MEPNTSLSTSTKRRTFQQTISLAGGELNILEAPRKGITQKFTHRKWTRYERWELQRYVANGLTNKQIAELMERTESSIDNAVHKWKYYRAEHLRQKLVSVSLFKKGHIPHNAGTKGVMKPNKTSFKKGQACMNEKPDGCISIRKDQRGVPYKHIRLGKSQWEYMHRHIWAQAHGTIPAGMIVAFIDGDTMNCSLDNLQLLTKTQNMARNRNSEKASKSMRNTYNRERVRKSIGLKPLTKLRVK